MIVNSIIAIGLMPFYGWIAAPIATTISAWAMIILLVLGTKNIGAIGQLTKLSKSKFLLIILSSFIMGLFLWGATSSQNDVSSILERIIFAIFLILLGVVTYTATVVFLGGINLKELRASIKRVSFLE